MVTKPTDFYSSKSFSKGYRAETILAQVLRADGYYVVILADNQERGQNGAPGARNGDQFITLPDFQILKRGHIAYAEIKFKSEATWTRTLQQEDHGIGLLKWKMYQRIERESGLPVYLFIYEGDSGAVLYNRLQNLAKVARFSDTDKMDRGGMVFFPRASFGLWGHIAVLKGELWRQVGLLTLEEERDKLFAFEITRYHWEAQ